VVLVEDTPLLLIEAIRPDVLVKGVDYHPEQVVGADIVRRNSGKVLLVDPPKPGYHGHGCASQGAHGTVG
jgi:bifunctional ADP-heptose synthase (sugar kinase/adenylyltransferase)